MKFEFSILEQMKTSVNSIYYEACITGPHVFFKIIPRTKYIRIDNEYLTLLSYISINCACPILVFSLRVNTITYKVMTQSVLKRSIVFHLRRPMVLDHISTWGNVCVMTSSRDPMALTIVVRRVSHPIIGNLRYYRLCLYIGCLLYGTENHIRTRQTYKVASEGF